MQDQSQEKNSKPDNIVSLFAARQEAANKSKSATTEVKADAKAEETTQSKESFNDLMRKNAENDERLRKERLKANSSVLKSYRIKN